MTRGDMENSDPKLVVVGGVFPSFTCTSCSEQIPQSEEAFARWFTEGKAECSSCHRYFDLEASMVSDLASNPTNPLNACLFGAEAAFAVLDMMPGETVQLEPRDIGLADGAGIVYIGATPYNDAGWPCIVSHGRLYPVQFVDNKITLYGRPHKTFVDGEGVPHAKDPFGPPRHMHGSPSLEPEREGQLGSFANDMGDCSVLLTIVVCRSTIPTTRQLVSAAKNFQDGQLLDVLVPANVAAETAICGLVRETLRQFSNRESIDGFLDVMTYGHSLNVLLNVCSKILERPRLADSTRLALNRLRKLRNAVAHDGTVATMPTTTEVAQYLVAAFLGTRYASLLTAQPA